MNFKKIFFLGFSSGILAASFLIWLFVFRYPVLLSQKAISSYSMGQQIGRNLKNQNYDISYHVFAAAVRDAQESASRLNAEQLAEGRKVLFSQTPQSAKMQNQMSRDLLDENGFFTLESGLKFKLLADSKKTIKNIKELSRFVEPASHYEFYFVVLDPQQQEISGTRKKMSFKRQQLNSDLIQILNYLGHQEKVQLQIATQSVSDLEGQFGIQLGLGQQLVIQRLNAKKR